MPKKQFLYYLLFSSLFACNSNEVLPKPKAELALEYGTATYADFSLEDCPYQFEINTSVRLQSPKVKKKCWVNLAYPKQKATIFITYNKVEDNLKDFLIDAQKLPLQHTIKADKIEASTYENTKKNSYGTFYEVEGDAASQAQFYLTDSINHFLTGSIYFEAAPNYDSILPAAAYLKKDIRHIMETLQWK